MASQSMLVDGIEVEAGWCHIEVPSEEYIQPVDDAGNWF
jgi:hypothetical protein